MYSISLLLYRGNGYYIYHCRFGSC